MKVQLLIDAPNDVRSGYVNIDPRAPEGDEHGRIPGDVFDLAHTVDAGEATEIVALDILDLVPLNDADKVIGNWLSRLARGGKLTISVVDLRAVSRAVLAGDLPPEDVNELLYGRQDQPWRFKKSAYTVGQLADEFVRLGYRVLAKRIINCRAVITVERP